MFDSFGTSALFLEERTLSCGSYEALPGLDVPYALVVLVQSLKEGEVSADDLRVANSDRIVWGHALAGVGVLIRRLSGPGALLALTALMLAGATSPAGGVGTVLVLGIPVLCFLGGRGLAVLLGAIGWVVFPPEHRAVLSEIASEAQPGL